MTRKRILIAALLVFALVPSLLYIASLGGAQWWSVRVPEDPGISWMVLTDNPQYRVLRDFAAPGATRRMHHHGDVTWHQLTLATGKLSLMVRDQPAVEVTAGQTVTIPAGVEHTFTNSGTTTATIVEVFGKAAP